MNHSSTALAMPVAEGMKEQIDGVRWNEGQIDRVRGNERTDRRGQRE